MVKLIEVVSTVSRGTGKAPQAPDMGISPIGSAIRIEGVVEGYDSRSAIIPIHPDGLEPFAELLVSAHSRPAAAPREPAGLCAVASARRSAATN